MIDHHHFRTYSESPVGLSRAPTNGTDLTERRKVVHEARELLTSDLYVVFEVTEEMFKELDGTAGKGAVCLSV